jgi:hypothetical protein
MACHWSARVNFELLAVESMRASSLAGNQSTIITGMQTRIPEYDRQVDRLTATRDASHGK